MEEQLSLPCINLAVSIIFRWPPQHTSWASWQLHGGTTTGVVISYHLPSVSVPITLPGILPLLSYLGHYNRVRAKTVWETGRTSILGSESSCLMVSRVTGFFNEAVIYQAECQIFRVRVAQTSKNPTQSCQLLWFYLWDAPSRFTFCPLISRLSVFYSEWLFLKLSK